MYDFYAYSKNAISNFERLKKGKEDPTHGSFKRVGGPVILMFKICVVIY